MKRAILLLLLAAVAFAGWRYYATSIAPERRYKAFAEEVLRQHYDAAAAMSDGLSAKEIEQNGTQEAIGAGPAMFQTLFSSRFEVSSRESAPDGALVLHAVQTVLFNPAGVESALRPAMAATMNQTATLRKSGGAWKISAFENKLGKVDSLMRH
jgi:hypothetical protein